MFEERRLDFSCRMELVEMELRGINNEEQIKLVDVMTVLLWRSRIGDPTEKCVPQLVE